MASRLLSRDVVTGWLSRRERTLTARLLFVETYGHLAPDYQDEAAAAIGRK
jgi:hypothetical protein